MAESVRAKETEKATAERSRGSGVIDGKPAAAGLLPLFLAYTRSKRNGPVSERHHARQRPKAHKMALPPVARCRHPSLRPHYLESPL